METMTLIGLGAVVVVVGGVVSACAFAWWADPDRSARGYSRHEHP